MCEHDRHGFYAEIQIIGGILCGKRKWALSNSDKHSPVPLVEVEVVDIIHDVELTVNVGHHLRCCCIAGHLQRGFSLIFLSGRIQIRM